MDYFSTKDNIVYVTDGALETVITSTLEESSEQSTMTDTEEEDDIDSKNNDGSLIMDENARSNDVIDENTRSTITSEDTVSNLVDNSDSSTQTSCSSCMDEQRLERTVLKHWNKIFRVPTSYNVNGVRDFSSFSFPRNESIMQNSTFCNVDHVQNMPPSVSSYYDVQPPAVTVKNSAQSTDVPLTVISDIVISNDGRQVMPVCDDNDLINYDDINSNGCYDNNSISNINDDNDHYYINNSNDTNANVLGANVERQQKNYQRHFEIKNDERLTDKPTLNDYYDTEFSCVDCGKQFNRKQNLVRHVRRIHKCHVKRFKCRDCGKSFTSASNLKVHTQIHTGTKLFMCQVCGKSFIQKTNLITHLNTHSKQRYFCSSCDSGFEDKVHYISHVCNNANKQSRIKRLRCEYCGKMFTQVAFLNIHIKSHTGEKPFSCEYCDARFSQRFNLNVHVRKHNGEKPYICNVCKKKFFTLSTLHRHSKTQHDAEKRYQCEICWESFTQRAHMQSHSATHKSFYHFECKYCMRGFMLKSDFMRHQSTHEVLKRPFICLICHSKYIKRSSLIAHINRIHSPVNQLEFECDYCSLVFNKLITLAGHLLLHAYQADTLCYKCDICARSFDTSSSLKNHITIHKQELSPRFV